MTDPLQESDRIALKDLLSCRGWELFCAMVRAEITDEFEEHITKVLANPDTTMALDKAHQVMAVRQAGLRWLAFPKQKLGMLEQQQQAEAHAQGLSRRARGL